jgi:hypothetical protein
MDISLERSLWQRMFGLGTIKCCSADKTMKDFEIKNIKKPREVKEQLSTFVEEERTRKRVSGREFMNDHDEHDEHDGFDDDINV